MIERPKIYAEVVTELGDLEWPERDRLLDWCIDELSLSQLSFALEAIRLIVADRHQGTELP